MRLSYLTVALCLLVPTQALAYIGPGAGISAIGTALALIAVFVLAVIGFVWYPVKRLLRGRKQKPGAEAAASDDDQA